jgi:hypothetical protein
MTSDRYLKGVLTVIAACLVYLCLVMTPWPMVSAAAVEPTQVVIVGWKPWASDHSLTSLRSQPLPVAVVKMP